MPVPRSFRTSLPAGASTKLTSSGGPSSPTFSDATNASVMNFGPDGPEKIITRMDLKASLQACEDLMNACTSYRAALVTMSQATFAFANAMEVCSRLKGPSYESSTRMQAASGLHHLMGNHWHVMADTLDRKFEKPLRQHLENYRLVVNERSATYEKALNEKSKIIRQTEMGNMNKRGRSLQSFREALIVLQQQVDDLDELKARHYQEIMEHEEEVWDFVQGKVCFVVRSTMDMFDRFTAKASDPVIEPMLQSIPDPFDSYGPQPTEDQIFTILPPLSVIANTPSSSTASPFNGMTPDMAPSEIATSPTKANWIPSPSLGYFSESNSAWAEEPSPAASRSRSATPPLVRPVSPPPTTSPRRHSHPPSSRKAESKLRSVLTVIDEAHPRLASEGGGNINAAEENQSPPASEPVGANGVARHDPLPPDDRSGWMLSHSSRGSSSSAEEPDSHTPRRSVALDDSPPLSHESPMLEPSRTPTPDLVMLPT